MAIGMAPIFRMSPDDRSLPIIICDDTSNLPRDEYVHALPSWASLCIHLHHRNAQKKWQKLTFKNRSDEGYMPQNLRPKLRNIICGTSTSFSSLCRPALFLFPSLFFNNNVIMCNCGCQAIHPSLSLSYSIFWSDHANCLVYGFENWAAPIDALTIYRCTFLCCSLGERVNEDVKWQDLSANWH